MADALIICRFVQFGAAMLLFGISSFFGLLVPRGLRDAMQTQQRRSILALSVIGLVTAIAWLCLEAGLAGDGWADTLNPGTLAAILADTNFGQVWVGRLVLGVLLLGVPFLPGRSARLALILLSLLFLASLGLVGHAAMQEGLTGWAHRANQMLHLLAAGFWLGALPPLLYCLTRLRATAWMADVEDALKRFSGLGHVAVAIVVLTGVINIGLILHQWPIDLGSPYQALMAIKLGLVGLMILIALGNRYILVPMLDAAQPEMLRGLAIGTGTELLLGAAVIGLVSAFATFDPV